MAIIVKKATNKSNVKTNLENEAYNEPNQAIVGYPNYAILFPSLNVYEV